MIETGKKLHRLLDAYYRRRVPWIIILLVVTAVVQTIGVASVMPFLAVLAEPEIVRTHPLLNPLYEALAPGSEKRFLYLLGLATSLLFSPGTGMAAFSFRVVTRFTQMQQYQLSRRLMADYLRRPCVFFLTRDASELAKIVLQEASHAVSGALPPAMRLFGDAVLAIAITALLIATDPLLALGVASAVALSYGAVFLFARTWLRRIGEERVDGAGTPCGSRQHGT